MLPTAYRVRDVLISPNVVLAPMEGVTDLTFRRLIRQIGGVGLVATEFIHSGGLKQGRGREWQMAQFDEDERPIAVQLYGRDPVALAEGARLVESMGATICDLNMGCPSKKVCAHSGGSALMKDPALVRQIVAAVRAATTLPLTVKMRSGFDHGNRNAAEIAWICQEEGAEALTVHWRTRADKYAGERDVSTIAAVKQRVSVPVLGNGDVTDIPSALRMFEETGCDGVMVGRGAIRNPWLIRQIGEHLRGEQPVMVSLDERRRVLLGYLRDIQARFEHPGAALGRFKKIANHFAQGLPGGEALRSALLHSMSVAEAEEKAEAWFGAARAQPPGAPSWSGEPLRAC